MAVPKRDWQLHSLWRLCGDAAISDLSGSPHLDDRFDQTRLFFRPTGKIDDSSIKCRAVGDQGLDRYKAGSDRRDYMVKVLMN